MDLKNKHSALRTPLNDILGSKGHIKVLRTLSESGQAMSPMELLERTRLSKQGVYNVVQRLIEEGILESVGSGKQQQVIIREEYPLAEIIKGLFKAEQSRYDRLIAHLKKQIQQLEVPPKSVWISGNVDDYGDPLKILILSDSTSIDQMLNEFRAHLIEAGIEKEFDVTIEIKGLTRADLQTRQEKEAKDIILLWGAHPAHYLKIPLKQGVNNQTHRDLDHRSHSDAHIWSKMLKAYPEIIQRAISYLNNQIHEVESGEKEEYIEWRNILESMSTQRLTKFLQSDSERATRLRQSLPFWPVLNEMEREKLFEMKAKKDKDE